jgi:hypothetical protein
MKGGVRIGKREIHLGIKETLSPFYGFLHFGRLE